MVDRDCEEISGSLPGVPSIPMKRCAITVRVCLGRSRPLYTCMFHSCDTDTR